MTWSGHKLPFGLGVHPKYVQYWTLMKFNFLTVSVLIGKKSPKHTQFWQIWSNMKMSNNPAKYEVLIKQYLRSILDINVCVYVGIRNWPLPIGAFQDQCKQILIIIIHQIFLPTRDWSKRITWPSIPQLELGNIQEYSPIFKTARVAKKIWAILNYKDNSRHLGRKICSDICPWTLSVPHSSQFSSSSVCFSEQIMSADTNIRAYFRAKWRLLLI